MPKISLVIPSYNRKNDLERCIKSILIQNFKDYEIIIVDNDSKDKTREFLEKLKKILKNKLRVILNENNVGASEARNQALRLINSEYVLFLDSDAELLKKDVLKQMVNILGKDEKIGQLGGEIIEGKMRISNSERNEDGCFLWAEKVFMGSVSCVTTANCIMRTKIIKKIGGFDPYYIYGYEDNDLSWRIRQLGLKCLIDSRVSAIHHVSFIGRTSNFFRFHRNRVRFLIKKENWLFLLFLPFIDLVTTIKLAPARVREFANKPMDKIAWFNNSDKGKKISSSKLKKILILGSTYSINLLKAYIWNILHLNQTLYIRYKNPNFILKK